MRRGRQAARRKPPAKPPANRRVAPRGNPMLWVPRKKASRFELHLIWKFKEIYLKSKKGAFSWGFRTLLSLDLGG